MLRDEANDASECEQGVWTGPSGRGDEVRRVHEGLCRIAKRRAELDAEELSLLRSAKAITLWRDLGYASFFEYLECELGYGPRTAHDRLRVAEALEDLPLIEAALVTNQLRYSAVRELTRVANNQHEGEWIARAEGHNLREIEELVAGHKYGDHPDDPKDPRVRRQRVVYDDIMPDTVAMARQARVVAETEAEKRLDDNELLQTVFRSYLAGSTEPGSDDNPPRPAYQMAITTCRECKRSWQNGGGREFELDKATVERAQCDATLIGALDAASPERTTSTVTPRMREHIWARDKARCTYPKCRSVKFLDIHHIKHQSDGGGHHASNLTLTCGRHHKLHHDGLLEIRGTAPDYLEFTRRPKLKLEPYNEDDCAHVGRGE